MAKSSKLLPKPYVVSIPSQPKSIFYVDARNHNGACEEAFKALGGKALVLNPENEQLSARKVVQLAHELGLSGEQIDSEVKKFKKKFY